MTVMSGMEKAALVIMQMSQTRAAEVMRQFSDAEAEELAGEIIRLRKVEGGQADAVIAEFHARTRSGRADTRGGRDAAALLLEASFGQERAAGLLDRAASAVGGRSFEFLDTVETANLIRVLEGESAEVIALVLAHLKPERGSAVLGTFDATTRADIAQALATMSPASPDIVDLVAETVKTRIRLAMEPSDSTEVKGGVQPLVEIINRSDIATEHELLEELERRDPELAEEVRSRMLGFDDIVKLEARDVQQVIRGVDAASLAIALKSAAPELVEIVRANMSERNRELLDDEMSMLGKLRKAQVVEARAGLVRAMRELATNGSITVAQGEDEDIVD